MHIAVDAMGGDYAPRAVVRGAYKAATQDGVAILLVGDEARIGAELGGLGEACDLLTIEHAEQVVEMDDPATAAIRKKRGSSLRRCADLVKEDRAQAMVTAGNTGAAMITAKLVIGTVDGVDRPALAAVFPNRVGNTVVLDVGANIDSKLAHLRQFAVMGHCFAQEFLSVEHPRIGLMSIGEEASKGTDFTRRVFEVLETTGLNFIGNVEGGDVFRGTADVIVCDGFVGNVLLKGSEAAVALFASLLKSELQSSWRTKLGSALARPALDNLLRQTDYREYGAAPLLGLQGGCFVGHGRSDAKAIRSSIRRAVEFCAADLHAKIRDKVGELHTQEDRLLGDQEEPVR